MSNESQFPQGDLVLSQPFLQLSEGSGSRLLQRAGREPAHPAVADAERCSNLAMLADMGFHSLSGLLDALFYTQGVDTIVLTVAL